jgi:hypothetical protein
MQSRPLAGGPGFGMARAAPKTERPAALHSRSAQAKGQGLYPQNWRSNEPFAKVAEWFDLQVSMEGLSFLPLQKNLWANRGCIHFAY